jgi:trehalose-6-phosphate synthase
MSQISDISECVERVKQRDVFLDEVKIGLGVDRLDYTKGIIERFRSIERLLEKFPQWIGKFSFVQIAAPSRSSISAYRIFDDEVRSMARHVNLRFGSENYTPIVLKIQHHGPDLVYEYMRSAHLCFVSSLHDGMNLVAKEYAASRDDEMGVLILSMFAGASRELTEALIVNPYDIDQCASALHTALSMSQSEQRERMRALRLFIKEFNIYRWAGKMLLDASTIRKKNRFLARFSGEKSTPPIVVG